MRSEGKPELKILTIRQSINDQLEYIEFTKKKNTFYGIFIYLFY